jgi:integrase
LAITLRQPPCTYNIKKPGNGRRTFAVSARVRRPDGSSSYQSVSDERLDSINSNLLSEKITFESALKQVKAFVRDLYRDRGGTEEIPVFNSDNTELLRKYWRAEYADRELVDPDSARYDFERAISAVGSLSIISASKQKLLAQINESCPTANSQRRVVDRLNQLLKYAGRDFRLPKRKPEYKPVKHLTLAEFQLLVSRLSGTDHMAAWVAFTTGCRKGELLDLTPSNVRGNHLYVETQLDKELIQRETKTRRGRSIYVIPEGRKYLEQWISLPVTEKKRLRKRKWHAIVKQIARQLWPDNRLKHICWHDLRHGYAIHLLKQGLSLSKVALLLGNHITVCQRYYSGFSLDDDGIQSVVRQLESI